MIAKPKSERRLIQNSIIMKNFTLAIAAMLFFGNVAHANRNPILVGNFEPIVFTERGIEFMVFADGQIDFNTRPTVQSSYYYRKNNAVNNTFGAVENYEDYGVLVQHDNFGRVRRIGNVYLNYDGQNRIKRIGSVYMSYNRFALTNVGGLSIHYNNRGEIIGQSGAVHYRMPQQMHQQTAYYYGPTHQSDYYYKGVKPKN